jgi:uncharacterized protein (DUF2252 family)
METNSLRPEPRNLTPPVNRIARSLPCPDNLSAKERSAAGKALRKKVPRSAHAKWSPPSDRPDPIDLLRNSDRGRIKELLPIRYDRMRQSPFAFYRGAAALMAFDLSHTPTTRLRVQACGDCHIANFGGFGSPERRLVFDINDFDETLPAPWEWDVKRLAASVMLSGRDLGLRERNCTDAAEAAVGSYCEHMREYAEMCALDVWYSHLDAQILIDDARTPSSKKRWQRAEAEARAETSQHMLGQITKTKNGHTRFRERPLLVYHPPGMKRKGKLVEEMFHRYRLTLPEERRVILDRYHIVDIARKVVGVGSVGTRCAAMLLLAGKHDPLFLQFKQANASVLEPYVGKSRYDNHGERVVTGQRMLQAASDVFLGWTRDDDGHDYYFRQLRDMKMKIDLGNMPKEDWCEYVEICGWALARAHARTGDPAMIAGYLGKNDLFDVAISKFAAAYADQTESDYEKLLRAIRAGKLPVEKQVTRPRP